MLVEIGIWVLKRSPHQFSSSERVQIWLDPSLLLEPRLCVHWLIHAIHSIPTLPMCHYKYNEWLEKVEIGIHPPQLSLHPSFWVAGGESFSTRPLHFIPTLSVCRMIQPFCSISTLPISFHWYNEWLEKVETGIHRPKPSPHPGFWVAGGENFGAWPLHFTPR